MKILSEMINRVDAVIWGPFMLVLLVGTGMVLTIRCHFLPWRNLFWAIGVTLKKEGRSKGRNKGEVSAFSALTTALAATIGTGNIVGVATAMALGGPGALVWMWIAAAFGLSSKFAECMLASKYREINERGEVCGGPMYTIKNTMGNKRAGRVCSRVFAFFAVMASFGIGNMTQSNSIALALRTSFSVSEKKVGLFLMAAAFFVMIGGIHSIARVSSVLVPLMAVLYVLCGILVLMGNRENLPGALRLIVGMAFTPEAAGGALCGNGTISIMQAARYGIARGVFSNEAGMGSAAISAAAAATDHPVRQGYISMTGTFWDTFVVCTVTGLVIASSGMLGQIDPATGAPYTGAALTLAAFSTIMGNFGEIVLAGGITLFAFSTILGWEYHGEKAFEYLVGSCRYTGAYRIVYTALVYLGAVETMEIVWGLSDIANALMALPNLLCLLFLHEEIAGEIRRFEKKYRK